MANESVLARIARDPHLPTPAPVALKVLEKASKPDCALEDIARIISHDPGLCAKILKIVNSAFLALPQKVTAISRAMSLLGIKRVRALVLSLSLPAMQRRSANDAHMRDHWKASVAAAMAAREWAVAAKHPDPDNEMAAGLLCDLGALLLREVFPVEYGRLLEHPPEVLVRSQCELEEELMGVNHAEVGAYLLRRWGLPEDITEAIRHHHNPGVLNGHNPVVTERSFRLHFANIIGQLQVVPSERSLVTGLLQLAGDRFHLNAPQLEKFLDPLHEKIGEFASMLNVEVGATHHYPTLIARATEELAQIASETALENIRVHQEKDQADQLRQRSEEELDRLARRHELILDAAGEGIFGVDRQGLITFANPAAAKTIGWPRAELIGQHHHDVLHPAAPGRTPLTWEASPIHAVLEDGQTRRLEQSEFTSRDGHTFSVHYTCAPIHEANAVIGAVVTFRDISDLKQTEEALRRSEEQYRQAQKMEAVGQLAGGVAHDFNNLLTIITGYGDLLVNGLLSPDDPSRGPLSEILKASDRASTLTRQLLAFSRRQVTTPRVLLLNTVVLDMDKMLRRLIGEDIELTNVLAADLGPIKGDPGQIEQILLNLAVNARDAMPRGGQLTIETANTALDETYARTHPEARPGPYVTLAVTDTGCGMDEATKARIFEPFFTTKGAGKGTGLGLATVYGIVKQSDGSIFVSSELGRGTSFKVYLPRIDENVTALRSTPPMLAPRPSGQETLLLVEDDDGVRALTRTVLKNSAYDVLEAIDGGDALRWAEKHPGPIHLLVTDVVMPGMSGRVLAERLTALRPDMKVLYISGYTDEAVIRHGLQEDEVAFLQKPFTPDALARKVREVLDR